MNASDLIRILERAGWYQVRRLGNHHILMHANHPNLISIPDVGDKPLKRDLLNDIFREAGLKARVRKISFQSPLYILKSIFGLTR